jgi:hypothetical protein
MCLAEPPPTVKQFGSPDLANFRIATISTILLLANSMKLFTDSHAADFGFFFMALAGYVLFLLLAVVTRIGRGRTPLGRFNRLHFRTSVAYILASVGYLLLGARDCTLATCSDWLIGILANFFVLAQASVSTAIVSIIHAHGGRATLEQCNASYAGGEGFAYIKKNRMSRIQNLLGWVEDRDSEYYLTRAGRWMARLTKLMLRIWNLKQLGAGG